MIKILLTDANNQNTLAAVRHLGALGYEVYIGASTRFNLASLSKYTYKPVFLPTTSDPDFINILIKTIRQEKIDCLIPIGYETVNVCSQARNRLSKETKFVIPDQSSLSIAADKERLIVFAQNNNINVPKTIIIKDLKDIDKLKIVYPVVLKSAIEGVRPLYVHGDEEMKQKLPNLLKKRNKILMQEYIQGQGLGYFGLYNRGQRLISFMHRRIREYPASGGASTAAESFYDLQLEKQGDHLLKKLHWTGVAMVEFKQEENKRLVLMEINPKFWGSLELSLSCGVDFLSGFVKLALGQKVSIKTGYPISRRFQWPLPNDFLHCISCPRDFKYFLRDLLNPRVSKDIRLSDPLPLIWQILNTFYRLIRIFNPKRLL